MTGGMATDVSDNELKIAVEEGGAWARRLTITVPAARVTREREAVARRVASRVRLPGFRKGKVPSSVVEKRYGAAIDNEAVERVIGDAYKEAIEREGLQPITQGSVENLNYEAGADLTFDVALEIRPEITLDRLGGFKLKRERAEVTDAEVDKVVQRLREDHALWQPVVDEAPIAGDMVRVEITPLEPLEGEESGEPPKPRQYRLVLGEEEARPEVEEAVRGLRPGEETEFSLVHEEEGGGDHEHRARLLLLEAKRPELPEVDDEFARSMGDFEDVAGLRTRVREDLEREADADAEAGVRRSVVERLIEANPFEVPGAMIDQYLDRLIRAPEGSDPSKVEAARTSARPAAERALKRMLLVERVAELEGLEATAADLDQRLSELSERYDRPPAEIRQQLQKSGQLSALEDELTEDKVFKYLESLSTVE